MFVLDDHPVPALATGNHPLQQRSAWARYSARLAAVVSRVVGGSHALDLLKRAPGNVGWVHIRDTDLPLVLRESQLFGTKGCWIGSHRARTSVDEGSGIGWVFENLQDRRYGGSLPHQVAEAVAPRKQEIVAGEKLQDLDFPSVSAERL